MMVYIEDHKVMIKSIQWPDLTMISWIFSK